MNSLKFKILGFITAVVVLIIAASGYIGFEMQRSSMMAMAENSNALLTDTIRNTIASSMRSGQERELGDILGRLRNRDVITALRIVDEDGRVLKSADSGEIGRIMAPPASAVVGHGTDSPLTLAENGTYQSLVPIHNEADCHGCHSPSQAILGYLHTELSLQHLTALIQRQRNATLFLAVTIIVLITITITGFLMTYVDRPLQQIIAAMRSVEQGDFDIYTRISSSTEMQQLSEKFNVMVDRLKRLMNTTIRHERDLARAQEKLAHHREIHQMNRRLEEKVEEVEGLNLSLEQRIAEIETARGRISALAGELETKNESLQQAVSRLSTLYRVGLAVNSTMDQDAVMNLIVRTALSTLKGQVGYILIKEPETGRLRLASHFVGDNTNRSTIPDQFPDIAVSTRVVNGRSPLLITETENTESADGLSMEEGHRSIICSPLLSKEQVLGTITVVNRQDGNCFDSDDLELLSTIAAQAGVALHNAQLYEAQQRTYVSTIHALVSAVEASDSYLRGHSERVTRYSIALARGINLPPERIEIIERAAILHDIGKIGIDLTVLHKPDRLTDDEFSAVRQHPAIGMKILEPISFLDDVRCCIGQHHERFDGTGYPFRLQGRDLMLESRILAIADSYDAMTSDRPYRLALPREVALQELINHAGTQFDPDLVHHFVLLARQHDLSRPLEPSFAESPMPGTRYAN